MSQVFTANCLYTLGIHCILRKSCCQLHFGKTCYSIALPPEEETPRAFYNETAVIFPGKRNEKKYQEISYC